MSSKLLYRIWDLLFVACAAFCLLDTASPALKLLSQLISLLFFVPPLVILSGHRQEDRIYIRCLSALSLGGTVLVLLLNIWSAPRAGHTLGSFLHSLLAVISAPMFSSFSWYQSLFLWACLLVYSFQKKQ